MCASLLASTSIYTVAVALVGQCDMNGRIHAITRTIGVSKSVLIRDFGNFLENILISINPLRSTLINLAFLEILLFFLYRSEEHTSELQSRGHLVCRLLLEKKNELQSTIASR